MCSLFGFLISHHITSERTPVKKTIWMFCAFFGMVLSSGHGLASDEGKTRVGTCEDARSQQEYFCDMKNAENDSMVALGTACRNAKINVKEACEGVVLPDTAYESCVMEQTC